MTSEANSAGICLTQPNTASATDDSRFTSPGSPSDTPASEVPPAPTEPKSLQHQPSSGSRPTLPPQELLKTAALDAGVPLRDVQDAASHADPRTTMRYDRARMSLDRHATYVVATFIAGASR